jgi:hypothetical protein
MAKRKSITPVVANKKELLTPKMEFLPLEENGAGFFVRELGGKSLLEYKEFIKQVEKESVGGELSTAQSLDLMVDLVYRTACNADGTSYFLSKEEADLFANISLSKLEKASDKAMEMSGMGANKNLKNDLNSSSTDS